MKRTIAHGRTTHYLLSLDREPGGVWLQVFSRATGDFLSAQRLTGRQFPGFAQATDAQLARWLRTVTTDMDTELVTGGLPFYMETEGPKAWHDYWEARHHGQTLHGRHEGMVETLDAFPRLANPFTGGEAWGVGLAVAGGVGLAAYLFARAIGAGVGQAVGTGVAKPDGFFGWRG